MVKAIIAEDAPVLIPNESHQNFTQSKEVLPQGLEVVGEIKMVKGLRQGKPFTYKLFKTDQNQIIYLKKIKPMANTEVTLGADAAQTPTEIKLPNVSNLGIRPVIGTLAGLGIGFWWAKKKGYTGTKKALWLVGGAAAGFFAGKYLQSNRKVVVKPSK